MSTPYRAMNVRVDLSAPADPPLPRLIVEPAETLVEMHRKEFRDHRQIPAWWMNHAARHRRDAASPSPHGFVLLFLMTCAWWALCGGMIATIGGMGAVYCGCSATAACALCWVILQKDASTNGSGGAFGWLVKNFFLSPVALYLTGKEALAWTFWNRRGKRWTLAPWSEAGALAETLAAFRGETVEAHKKALASLRARIDDLETERGAANTRAKTFADEAAAARAKDEQSLSSRLSAAAEIEMERGARLAAQIAHMAEAADEAGNRIEALSRFTDQYAHLQESRQRLRRTGSLDPRDASDLALRALLKAEHLGALESLRRAEEPFHPRQAADAADTDDLAERIETAAARKTV